MRTNKVIKILIITLILLICIILSVIKYLKSEKFYEYGIPDPPTETVNTDINRSIKEVTIKNNYFIVKNIIDSYYSYCGQINTTKSDLRELNLKFTEEQVQAYIKEKQRIAIEHVYNMLNQNYITEFNLTADEISKKLGIESTNTINIIEKMYVVENSTNVSTYFVEGMIINTNTQKKENFNIGISLDMSNDTYCIYPQEYLEKLGYIHLKIGDIIENDIESIENKIHNTFEYQFVNNQILCEGLFENYKYNALYNTEKAYNMLDEEYRKDKFKSFEEYNNYIENNKKHIEIATISKYNYTTQEGNDQYILVDNNEKYYIFNISSIMNCKVILDTYTTDLPEFIKKYNSASDIEKVGYNIQKCIDSINDKDYSYMYKKLDETFKNNKYKTEEEFENYIKSNLFENNIVDKEVSTSSQNDIHIYNIEVKNKDNTNESKALTLIMKLGEGTDFTMSFSIK